MPVISDGAIAQYASQAGFKGASLRTAVAVALAESSGRTDVVNYLGCVGLWQVYQRMHPKWTTAQLKDPAINAQAAYEISSGGKSWGAWTTYTSGAYKRFQSRANAAAGSAGSAPSPGDATTAIPGVIPGADTANAAINAYRIISDRQTWVRVGEVALGVLLVFLALFWLTAKKAVPLAKTAVDFLPAGKVANVARAVTKVAKK